MHLHTTSGVTTNKLMLLLAIYRGTVRDEWTPGSRKADLVYLQHHELIKPSTTIDNDWEVTPIGNAMVRLLLTTGADLLTLTSSPLNKLKGNQDG